MQRDKTSGEINSKHYRPDIDGLRAICIVAAICFHAGIPGASGGFAAIDIFFVISGFVITKIIIDQQATGQFSLKAFYTRRILRLVPATIPIFLFTTAFCAVLMTREEISTYASSLFAAQFFHANFFFYFLSDYFDPIAESQPLLHFWSLAVEEQFYLVWPLAIVLAARWMPKQTFLLLVVASALVSLGLMFHLHPERSNTNFYMLPPRMWEFFAGIIVAYSAPLRLNQTVRELISSAGLIAVIFYLLTNRPAGGYPNVSTLIPVLGTAAVIFANELHHGETTQQSLTSRVLSASWLVWLGQISYSLYLWHWPVLTLTRLAEGRALNTRMSALLMLLVIPIAWASWRWVEQPWRKKARHKNAGWIAAGTLVGSLALAFAGASLATYANSFWERRPEVAQALQDHAEAASSKEGCHSWDPGQPIPDCTHQPASAPLGSWLLIGDSHADALAHDLSDMLTARNIALTHLTQSSCPVGLGFEVWQEINKSMTSNCATANQLMLEKIATDKRITKVILASRWAIYMDQATSHGTKVLVMKDGIPANYEQQLLAFLEELRRRRGPDLEIVMVGSVPYPGFSIPNCVEKRARLGRSTAACLTHPTDPEADETELAQSLLARIAPKANAQIIDIAAVFCDNAQCQYGTTDVLWWRDDNHLSRAGAKKAASAIASHLDFTGNSPENRP
jgi:peptidoglycan/LPS O-acetylase OafA/YrhL